MNIKSLIKKVEREMKPDEYGEHCVSFGRDSTSDNFATLRKSTQLELNQIRAQLSRLIPNEFDYAVSIIDGDMDGILEFWDGMTAAAGMPWLLKLGLVHPNVRVSVSRSPQHLEVFHYLRPQLLASGT